MPARRTLIRAGVPFLVLPGHPVAAMRRGGTSPSSSNPARKGLMASSEDIDALVEKFEGPKQSLSGSLALLVPAVGLCMVVVAALDCLAAALLLRVWNIRRPSRQRASPGIWIAAWLSDVSVGLGGRQELAQLDHRGDSPCIAFVVCAYGWFAYDGIVSRDGILLEIAFRRHEHPVRSHSRRSGHRLAAGSDPQKCRRPAGHRLHRLSAVFGIRPVDARRHLPQGCLTGTPDRIPVALQRGRLRHPD